VSEAQALLGAGPTAGAAGEDQRRPGAASEPGSPKLTLRGPGYDVLRQPSYGGPTLLDAPAFSPETLGAGPKLAAPPAREDGDDTQRNMSPPPDEALALLERIGGRSWQGIKENMGMAAGPPAETPADARERPGRRSSRPPEVASTLLGLPAASLSPGTGASTPQPESTSPSPATEAGGEVSDTLRGRPVPREIPAGAAPHGAASSSPPREMVRGRHMETLQGSAPPVAEPRPGVRSSSPPAEVPRRRSRHPAGPEDDDVGMTMLGMPAAEPRAEPIPPASHDVAVAYDMAAPVEAPRSSAPDDSLDRIAAPRRWGVTIAVVALLIVGLAGAAVVAGYMLLGRERYEIGSEVVPGGDMVRVRLSVAPVPTKGRLRLAGQERDIVDGRAAFDLPWSALVLGENRLEAVVIDAEGASRPYEVNFIVAYRAIADLSGLKATPPSYTVRFQVARGTSLKVAGRDVAVDQSGTYSHQILLRDAVAGSVDAGDTVVHRIPFSVKVGDGPVRNEIIDTSIPRTRLAVVTPLPGTIVDQTTIPCSGSTEPGAVVSVNGIPVPVVDGRFSSTVTLPGPGDHTVEVVSTAAGKAPRTVRLTVRRVQSMAPMIAEFTRGLDPSLDYRSLSAAPDARRGQAVRFRGRIINITPPSRGRMLMQLLVTEGCLGDTPCLLVVVFNGATTAALDSNVTIYGTVLGRWQGANERGDPLTAPSIQARFLVLDSPRR
jgi:hypothetical protein